MEIKEFVNMLKENNINFFAGVPDSILKPLCNYLINNYGTSKNHIITANEGNAVALAAGHYLSTGKIPCVYLQNSGLGNIINPVASLLNDKVYAIPCVFVIGWRGEPNKCDEPQHVFQGAITLELLKILNIQYIVLDRKTAEQKIKDKIFSFKSLLQEGKSVAFIVKKGGLYYNQEVKYKNNHKLLREEIVKIIIRRTKDNVIVSTTGKTSRELYELREEQGLSHKQDFLMVGAMGHCSSLALGVARNKPFKKVWCIDGDGSAIMHMGAMAIIGDKKPKNFIHLIINNESHESVGGQPTVARNMNFAKIALSCGYMFSYKAKTEEELDDILMQIKDKEGPILIEVKAAIGARTDLGRPTNTPVENKIAFMNYLKENN
ncbi:MAG: phosphonopyruvate decarboxylase [Eubacteriales bacterium]